jgi:hypothetical protein
MRLCLSLLLLFALCLSAGQEVLFKSDFAGNPSMNGWYDVDQKSPVQTKFGAVTDFEGKKVWKSFYGLFGISHQLKRTVMFDDNLKTITLKVKFYQPHEHRGQQVSFALTSRKTVAQDAGGAFWKLRDSGFIVRGYTYPIQSVNYLAFQVDGKQMIAPKAVKPLNLLAKTNTWTTWTLKYDHQRKVIDFYDSDGAALPAMTLYNVQMDGCGLNAVWLGSWGIIYESVEITAETI